MFSRTLGLLVVVFAAYWSITSLMPDYQADATSATTEFSVDRAAEHVKNIAITPHAVGFPGHTTTRAYIISQLKQMGLETTTQEGYAIGDWGNFSKAINILARIEGSGDGKALLLLSHYDSSPHSSYGASDDGSGVATLLEGIRTYLAKNQTPQNDIIILISDAEELGLNGAELFVKQHPWAKDVGLVLNFEARGSGGPSYMLIETNRGNAKLMEEFIAAAPDYPVGNSLAYSIYKMLPNDTDLTVFREKRDIEGFNFAFIDDHFDYHTELDNYQRMDKTSLAHQGSYLMPLLEHFSAVDVSQLKSLNDEVYFNVPIFKIISYPFEWIWPIYLVAVLLFIVLLVYGARNKIVQPRAALMGFVPALTALIANGLIGYFSWPILRWWYPWYKDILHGFTYNGHLYIFSFVILALAICFFIYHKFKKVSLPNLLVAPTFLWLVLCGFAAHYLSGASFFVLPVFGILAAILVFSKQERPNPLLLMFLALPAIFIFTPFIQMFPVGLGLKFLVAATVLTTLLFFLVLPFFGTLKNKRSLSLLCLFLFAAFGIRSHLNSQFTADHPKPSSLLYVFDADENATFWATYDTVLMEWNAQFFPERKDAQQQQDASQVVSSKYNTRFTHTAKAPKKEIPLPDIAITQDTIMGDSRRVTLCVTPQRPANRLDVYADSPNVRRAVVNGVALSEYYLEHRRGSKLLTHYISNNDFTELELEIPTDEKLKLTFYEASNDLLSHGQFSVPERPKNSIAMPFVLNDAVLSIKSVQFE